MFDRNKVQIKFVQHRTTPLDSGANRVQLHPELAADIQPFDYPQLRLHTVPVQHLLPSDIVPGFARAVRSPADELRMEELLKSVDSRIRSIRLDLIDNAPHIAVDVGLKERLPLSQTGQGVYRLVALFSELLGSKPQICLIDEIENGLHYTVLKQVWRGIAEISASMGIQIFATTHSRECLEAAQSVFFDEDPEQKHSFAVIQLMRLKDGVAGRVLTEDEVEVAVENQIELR